MPQKDPRGKSSLTLLLLFLFSLAGCDSSSTISLADKLIKAGGAGHVNAQRIKRAEEAKSNYERGVVFLEKKKYEKARVRFRKAISLKLDFPTAYRDLGMAQYHLGQYPEAAQSLTKSFYLNSEDPEVIANLGGVYLAMDQPKQALRFLTIATKKKNMARDNVHSNLGAAYGKLGLHEKAIKELELSLEINPDFPEAHINLGVIYEQTGQVEEALKEYETALKLNPTDSMALYNTGVLFARKKNYSKAVSYWKKSKRFDPDDGRIPYSMGWAYEKLNKKLKALNEYEQAARIDPGNARTHFSLGRMRAVFGENLQSIDSLNKAVNLKSDYSDAYFHLGLLYNKVQDGRNAVTNTMIAQALYKKEKNETMTGQAGRNLKSLFSKYRLNPADFESFPVQDTPKKKKRTR